MNAGTEVLIAQGIDAGGHGTANCASIVSLVPELVSEFPGVPILAAGGIVEASGILASLALGADGVVIGTRIAASAESAMMDGGKDLILQTSDGGLSTKR
jgi:nitronate monooxygenase